MKHVYNNEPFTCSNKNPTGECCTRTDGVLGSGQWSVLVVSELCSQPSHCEERSNLSSCETATGGSGAANLLWKLQQVVLAFGIVFPSVKRLPRRFFPEVSGSKLLAMTTTGVVGGSPILDTLASRCTRTDGVLSSGQWSVLVVSWEFFFFPQP